MIPDFIPFLVWGNTFLLGILGYFVSSKFREIDRVATLLNTTREQVARDHATREEMTRALERLGDRVESRLEKLSDKLDEFIKENP